MVNGTNTTNESPLAGVRFTLVFQEAWQPGHTWLERCLATVLFLSVSSKVISNGVLAVAMISQKSMRTTDYCLMELMAVIDCVDALNFFCAFTFIYKTASRWRCLLTLRHFYMIFGSPASTAILFAVSIDRFSAVAAPIWYWNHGAKFCKHLMVAVAVYTC